MNKHNKAEVMSGFFYIIIYSGALYHVLNEHDIVSAVVMTIGTIGGAIYGYLHIKAKSKENGGKVNEDRF